MSSTKTNQDRLSVRRTVLFILAFLWISLAASVSANILIPNDEDSSVQPTTQERRTLPDEWVWQLPEHDFDEMYGRRER